MEKIEGKIKAPEKKVIAKKKFLGIPVLMLMILGIVMISAAVLVYYGQVKSTVSVVQPIVFTVGGIDSTGLQSTESLNCNAGKTCLGLNAYRVTNNGDEDKEISLVTEDGAEIDTVYLKLLDYSYNHKIAGVQVDVIDEGDWLKWTYTYSATPTHTPKMTVAIDYPTGFAITTFDDGSHDGWYYAIDGGTTERIGDYSGVTLSWVETTASGNVLTVRIKKSALGNKFEWHGYANLDGTGVWINSGETGTGYSTPIFKVTIRELLSNPFNVAASSYIEFYPQFSVDNLATTDTYDVTTTVNPSP